MRAMSTPVGHSRLQPLQETQRSSASLTASSPSAPSWLESAKRRVLARPRVRWRSSIVARYDGHMVPASNLRQWPLLLHISTALSKPPHSLQSKLLEGVVVYPGLKRNNDLSSIREGLTILPGFIRPFGSSQDLISPSVAVRRGPKKGAIHSERTRPSPCSPEYAPLYSFTMAQASSAIARIFSAPSRRMSSTGRTCSVPTDACAYQVPRVPCFSNTRVRRAVYSARCSSGTAQSSMKETGFPSPFIDIMMFKPALRTSHTAR